MAELRNTWTPGVGGFYPKTMIFDLVGYRPYTEEVCRFHASEARVRIPCAPARTSKSFSSAIDCLGDPHGVFPERKWDEKAQKYLPVAPREGDPTRMIWVVSPNYNTNKEFDYLWTYIVENPKTRGLFHVERKSYSPKQGNMEILLTWGEDEHGQTVRTLIEGKSATNPESLQGEYIDYCIMSEAAEQDPKIWDRYLSPRCFVAVKPTTPKLKAADLKAEIEAGETNPELSVESFAFTPHCNPIYDWSIFWQEHGKAESRVLGRVVTDPFEHDCFDPAVSCQAEKDPWFAEQFMGRWTLEADRVLPFRWTSLHGEESHVLDEIPDWFDFAKYFVAVDYGYTDPTCVHWYAMGLDGTVLIYREIYESRLDPLEVAQRCRAISQRHNERIEYYCGDPQKPEVARFMRQLGMPVWDRDKAAMRDRAAGHLRVVDALSIDPAIGRPKLYVLSEKAGEGFGCPKTIAEWRLLRRKPGVVADEWSNAAITGADHAFDTCRYFLSSHPSRPSGVTAYIADKETERHLERVAIVRRFPGALIGGNTSLYAP